MEGTYEVTVFTTIEATTTTTSASLRRTVSGLMAVLATLVARSSTTTFSGLFRFLTVGRDVTRFSTVKAIPAAASGLIISRVQIHEWGDLTRAVPSRSACLRSLSILIGSRTSSNSAREGGSAIFFEGSE